MRWTRLAAAGVAIGVLAFAAPPAQAQSVFAGAGYKLGLETAPITQVSTSFRVPAVDCTGIVDGVFISVGLFSRGVKLQGGVRVGCVGAAAQFYLFTQFQEDGTNSTSDVHPGDLVTATMRTSATATRVTVTDSTTGVSTPPFTLDGTLQVASVGAYAELQVPAFPPLAMSATVNGGTPFTQVDRVRHVQTDGGHTVLGSGFPWNDGVHFYLYFRHQ